MEKKTKEDYLRRNYGSPYGFILSFILLITMTIFPASPVHAYRRGYNPGTDCKYATVRHAISLYDSPGGGDIGIIPEFTGIKVINREGSWYEVVFRYKKAYKYGWISKDEYDYDCLEYDGRDKQPIADGLYRFTRIDPGQDILSINPFLESLDQFKVTNLRYIFRICYDDHGLYYIKNNLTDRYMASSASDRKNYGPGSSMRPVVRWVASQKNAGKFHLYRDGMGYVITDRATGLCLCLTSDGVPGFEQNKKDLWRAVRTRPVTEKANLRDYVQYDGEWASFHYGEGKHRRTSSDNFTTSGCGIFATVNAIYSVTGHFPDPYELADYAVKHYYRIEGSGTDSGFFEAAADAFGEKYGFTFAGTGESLKKLRRRLKAGQTAITHVPGHYVTIVDYNPKTKKYLLLDPHYLPKRKTGPYGDWVSAQTLSEDTLYTYNFYFYEKTY